MKMKMNNKSMFQTEGLSRKRKGGERKRKRKERKNSAGLMSD